MKPFHYSHQYYDPYHPKSDDLGYVHGIFRYYLFKVKAWLKKTV